MSIPARSGGTGVPSQVFDDRRHHGVFPVISRSKRVLGGALLRKRQVHLGIARGRLILLRGEL